MEVCIDLIQSAVNAEKGGAKRVELCSNLTEGGTTPSPGVLRVVKQLVSLPVFVMIRPRGGDFDYNDHEFEAMKIDLKCLKEEGADGFVFGILNRDGSIDIPRCQELLDLSRPLPVTFSRAIDMTSDIYEALNTVVALGFDRVLTSGGENTALEGTPVIKKMIELAGDRIIVVPGGGITARNLQRILDESGAREFHASARSARGSLMEHVNRSVTLGATFGPPEYTIKVADRDLIRAMIKVSKETP